MLQSFGKLVKDGLLCMAALLCLKIIQASTGLCRKLKIKTKWKESPAINFYRGHLPGLGIMATDVELFSPLNLRVVKQRHQRGPGRSRETFVNMRSNWNLKPILREAWRDAAWGMISKGTVGLRIQLGMSFASILIDFRHGTLQNFGLCHWTEWDSLACPRLRNSVSIKGPQTSLL